MPDLSGADIRKRFETVAPEDAGGGGTSGGAAIRQLFDTTATPPPPSEPEQDPLSGSYLGGKLPPAPSRVIGLETPPGYERANMLPIARNTATGEIFPAIPGIIRDPIVGLTTQGPQIQNNALVVPGVTTNPQTGAPSLTPEAGSVAAFAASPLRFGGNALELQAPGLLERRAPLQIEQGNLLSSDAAARAAEHPVGPGVAVKVPGASPPTPAPVAVTPPGAPIAGAPKTAQEAKAVANAYYSLAEKSGGELTPQFTNKFIDNISSELPQTEAGRAVAGQGEVAALVDRIQGLRDKPMTLQAAQEVDEGIGNLIDKEFGVRGLSKEGKRLADIQSNFRNQIENAGPGDITGGSQGFDALGPARKAWSQAMKLSDLERIQTRAEMTDNPATSVRTQIRTLINNPSKLRGYSPEEIDALKTAAERGTIGSILHVFGSRLVPLAAGAVGFGTGPISGLLAAGGAHVASTALRNAATGIAERRLLDVNRILGRSVPPPPGQNLLQPPP